MNMITPLPCHLSGRVFLVPLLTSVLVASAAAQQSPYSQQSQPYPPQSYGYQQQRSGVGERVGGFVRRLFYGEPAPRQTSPQNSYQNGRSLDSFPSSGSRYQSPTTSRPPETTSSSTSKVASAPPKTKPSAPKTTPTKSNSSSSKYTPPKVNPNSAPSTPKLNPVQPKPQSSPPSPTPKTEPKVEQEPPAPVLDNTPTPPPSNVASLNKNLPSLDIPTIKQPETPASTVTNPVPPKEPAPPSSSASAGQFLVGKKTAVPGRVISPYPPYQELDVSGLASGSLALDPTTDKVFEIP